jgi:hypothetical protein
VRLGITWILGGVLLAVAVLPYAWRSSLPSPFSWLAAAAGLLLVAGLIWTAGAAWANGSRLAMVGVALLFVGWLTAFFGGAVFALAGLVVYPIGVVRSKIGETVGVLVAFATLGAAFAAAYEVPSQLAAFELGAAAAVALGVAVAAPTPPRGP